ncbi:hypothetical protein DTW90_05700 [Neorhizobium sp. P12A]|uniref:hypothetical protein n=1 Tax=Neorhizobium sp. P12A TaxID=2268027 RepID=UPI0011EDB2DB|nr:hypothetical protein [Neorhizobium sp. P12A]KAA0701087.1 hypothetical protein DTW90_05700 [Neorhizobium sp. P12A]
MAISRKLILHSPLANDSLLEAFVERCLAEGVSLLAIVGPDANMLEDRVDWIVFGAGNDPRRFLCTTSHPDESLEDVIEMANAWDGEGRVEQVFL